MKSLPSFVVSSIFHPLAFAAAVAIFVCTSPASAQVTGTVNLTDSLYAPIGTQYPPGTVRAYAEVVDPDKNADTSAVDTLSAIFSSPSDSGETVTLYESGANTGIFHGWINLDVLPGMLYQGKSVRAWIEEIQKTEKDSVKRNERTIALMKEIGKELKLRKETKLLRSAAAKRVSDGLLQVHTGESITVTYNDERNRYGDPQVITSSALLGGVSGAVSGVWTKANSPYTVTSDVYVSSGDSLKIEPGVVVKFWGGTWMYVYGNVETDGVSGDNVHFTSGKVSPSSGDWGGVFLNSGGTMTARFTEFSYGGSSSYGVIVTANNASGTFDNCVVRQNNNAGITCSSGGWAEIRDCIIEQNLGGNYGGVGLFLYDGGAALVNNSMIQNNGYGILSSIDYYCYCSNALTIDSTVVQNNSYSGIHLSSVQWSGQTVNIQHCSIINNGYYGILSDRSLTVQNSNLYGNGQYEIYNNSSSGLNAQYNWWGEATLAQMKAGENPGKILDHADYYDYGVVDYSSWREEPVSIKPKEMPLPLMSGWNLVSWNLESRNDSSAKILAGPMANVIVALGFESVGLTFDPHIPFEYNTLTKTDPYHGYWLEMKADDSLRIDGNTVERNTPIYLEAGYNLVSYLPTLPDSVQNAIRSVYDKTIIVHGFNGGALTYDPAIPPEFNTLTLMQPGFGYWIKTTDADTLIYPHVPLPMAIKPMLAGRNCQNSDGVAHPAHEWISVWADGIKIGDTLLPVGTIITAKDPDGIVCGKFTVHTPGKIGLMPVYADDPQTKIDEGAKAGQEVSIYIGDLQHAFKVGWTQFGDVICLSKQITSAENLLHAVPKEFKLYQNHPNPFNPTTHVGYQLPVDCRVTLKVYDVLGREVATLVDEVQVAGWKSVEWNPQQGGVASGTYIYRIQCTSVVDGKSYTDVKKMLLLR